MVLAVQLKTENEGVEVMHLEKIGSLYLKESFENEEVV